MKELSLRFSFEADASTVYSFIMDLQETRPDLFNTSGELNRTCWLMKGLRRDALYSIALEVSIWDTNRPDDVLVRNNYVAEIALTQEEAGKCVGNLYIEKDPQSWYRPEDSPWRHLEELEEPWPVPMNLGIDFIHDLWRGLVAEWQKQRKTEETRRSTKEYGRQGGTMDRVRTARELIEGGTSKTRACREAHIDPRTYDRYVAEIIDWENPLTET